MLLDSFAWMEYFMGTKKGEKVKRLVDEKISVDAAKIHAENKVKTPDFGLADAFIIASARSRKMMVLTGDPHFKNFEDAVIL
jgi:predicted nucleic acid-binding protein